MRTTAFARAVGAAAAAAALISAPAAAQAPPNLPGPPPGNGVDVPSSPGTAAAAVPPGTPLTFGVQPPGPGLLGFSSFAFNRSKRTFAVPIACDTSGTVTARATAAGTLGRAAYRCAGNRSTARFRLSAAAAKRVARARTLGVTATVHHAGRSTRLWFTLRAGGGGSAAAPGFWTDGHLQCTQAGAAQAYLAEPDFTTATPTVISTRGWIATYTTAGGWHWHGLNGEGAGRWETWTAGPGGVQQFHPAGAPTPVPFTWGPITVPAGQGISMVGVYEIVYWVGGEPQYRWQYVNAGATGAVAAGGATPACVYP
jgi:hypothetical protein